MELKVVNNTVHATQKALEKSQAEVMCTNK